MRLRNSETGRIQLYQPDNLDLLSLVESSTFLERKVKALLLKQRAGSGEYFNLTKCFVVISKIKWGELIQLKKTRDYPHLVYLNKKSLEGACGCKNSTVNTILNALEDLGIISINRTFLNANFKSGFNPTKSFPQSYSFKKAYRHKSAAPVDLPYTITEKQDRFFSTGLEKEVAKHDCKITEWLEENLGKLNFDSSVYDYIKLRDYSGSKKPHLSKDHAKWLVGAVDSLSKVSPDGSRHISGWWCNRKNRPKRVNHPIVFLHKDVRNFLRHDGERLWEVDQHASQPFLLLKLYEEGVEFPSWVVEAERNRYYRLWGNLSIYSNFYQSFIKLANLEITVDEMKGAMIKGVLNCRDVNFPPKDVDRKVAKAILAGYKEHFPILYSIIWKLKNVRDKETAKTLKKDSRNREKIHSQFAIKLQRIESSIFIDLVAAELMQKKIFCFPLHDALAVKFDDIEVTKKTISKHIENEIGFKPAIRCGRPKLQSQLEDFRM